MGYVDFKQYWKDIKKGKISTILYSLIIIIGLCFGGKELFFNKITTSSKNPVNSPCSGSNINASDQGKIDCSNQPHKQLSEQDKKDLLQINSDNEITIQASFDGESQHFANEIRDFLISNQFSNVGPVDQAGFIGNPAGWQIEPGNGSTLIQIGKVD